MAREKGQMLPALVIPSADGVAVCWLCLPSIHSDNSILISFEELPPPHRPHSLVLGVGGHTIQVCLMTVPCSLGHSEQLGEGTLTQSRPSRVTCLLMEVLRWSHEPGGRACLPDRE